MTTPIAIAARYWRRILGGRFLFDNGDRTGDSAFAIAGASLLNDRIRPLITAEVLDAFEAALLRELQKAASEHSYGYVTVGTDYGPDHPLSAALLAAGLPEWVAHGTAVLPWKTMLFVRGDRVFVREGYGAPERDLSEATP